MKRVLIIYSIGFLLMLSLKTVRADGLQEGSQQGSHSQSQLSPKVDWDSLVPAEELSRLLGQTEESANDPDAEKNIKEGNDLSKPEGDIYYWPRPFRPFRPWLPHHYPYYPYHPVPYPYPYNPYPHYTGNVVCYASDVNGNTYSAVGNFVAAVQQAALNQCITFSNMGCYARGCNY